MPTHREIQRIAESKGLSSMCVPTKIADNLAYMCVKFFIAET